jgi:peptide chain release factor 1
VFEQLADIEEEFDKLESSLSDIAAAGDRRATRDAGRRYAELKPVVDAWRALRSATTELDDARGLLGGESDPDMKAMVETEIHSLERKIDALEAELTELLLPRDPNDGRNAIVVIQGTEGGEEANLWAADLFRMYQRYCETHGLKLEVLSSQLSDHGGFRDISFVVKGPTAWSRLKYEGGPHRVQRVPETESQGRIHTSAATVAVLPEADEVDVEIDPKDIEMDVFRSSGPGGQSVNTTDSAVRLTHIPTGLVASCQNERSQLQNRERAMAILRARLLQLQQEQQDEALASARKEQVKSGGRSEKIRTYNYKDNRVTDHRIGLTVYALDRVLDGDLDEFIDKLAGDERQRQLGGE